MTRFGRIFLALILLGLIAFGSMLTINRRTSAPIDVAYPPASAMPPVVVGPSGLVAPVTGVPLNELTDTFRDARTGHIHGALDIMSPRGTPVVAAMGGTVEKLFESKAGGTTAYIRSADGRWITYYAHLDGYAPGLREGLYLMAGAPVGRVGFTGNASADGPHLHFEVKRMGPGQRWYEGTAVDPYPLLTGVR